MSYPSTPFTSVLICALLFAGCNLGHQTNQASKTDHRLELKQEIFYLIFPRSFYDSNGDKTGDLNGVTKKLDYIQSLGVTSIIMTPLYASPYYHNYFTNDFYSIDPEFGNLDDYRNMVIEIHRRGMKFYMDTELQYVPADHPWFKDSYMNPTSKFSNYVLYRDSLNTEAETMIHDLKGLKSYDGYYSDITMVNLLNTEVRQYVNDYYQFWIDPDKDGNFTDGVDGFRLDSFNDNMLGKNILTNLAESFWKPLIEKCRKINQKLIFIAEQASWNDDDAHQWMEKSGVDIAYSFGLLFNLSNPQKLTEYFTWSAQNLPKDKNMFAFLDQHDTDRILSDLNGDVSKNKQCAVLAYLTNMIPYIYYGQEIGMKGKNLDVGPPASKEFSDGAGIPVREPFEWTSQITDSGMALWFESIAPYWNSRNIKSGDGISVEEQLNDSNSLLHFYKKLLHFRTSDSAFTTGNFEVLKNANDTAFSYCRWNDDAGYVLAFNLSNKTKGLTITKQDLPFDVLSEKIQIVLSDDASEVNDMPEGNTIQLKLVENGYMVLKVK